MGVITILFWFMFVCRYFLPVGVVYWHLVGGLGGKYGSESATFLPSCCNRRSSLGYRYSHCVDLSSRDQLGLQASLPEIGLASKSLFQRLAWPPSLSSRDRLGRQASLPEIGQQTILLPECALNRKIADLTSRNCKNKSPWKAFLSAFQAIHKNLYSRK